MERVSERRGGRNVLIYASGFLQKPGVSAPAIQLTHEDLNGFMSTMFGMDFSKQLTLILHTPGGVINAAESLVAYLWSKFSSIEVVVPTLAMSAGTMIGLAADRVIMGRQSQLGPIDPQMPVGGRFVSARAVVDQFERAKSEVSKDLVTAHVWAPILQSMGPALLQEAQNALDYGEQMVGGWLAARMCAKATDPSGTAKRIAHHFNDATTHKSHGRRIGREEARTNGVVVEELETDQALQDDVLTAYHLVTIAFETGPATKIMASNAGRLWIKNMPMIRLPNATGGGAG